MVEPHNRTVNNTAAQDAMDALFVTSLFALSAKVVAAGFTLLMQLGIAYGAHFESRLSRIDPAVRRYARMRQQMMKPTIVFLRRNAVQMYAVGTERVSAPIISAIPLTTDRWL